MLYHLALAIIGLGGFVIASYIAGCKRKKKPLICPLRTSCDFVTTSDYSKFLGIHIEYIGMVYYGLVTLVHLAIFFFPAFATLQILLLGLIASSCAFLFSLYLTAIQAFVLKQWCTWCITSACLCAIIFALTYLSWSGASLLGIFLR